MKPIDSLKPDIKELSSNIEKLLREFMEKNGECKINIYPEYVWQEGCGYKKLVTFNVDVNIVI